MSATPRSPATGGLTGPAHLARVLDARVRLRWLRLRVGVCHVMSETA